MQKLMAANWKMYKTAEEAGKTAAELASLVYGKCGDDREVLICPPFIAIPAVAAAFAGKERMSVGGQNFYPKDEGAFTGEVSPDMLQAAGCSFALTGHSERRHVLGESDEFVGAKTAFGLEKGLKIILCVGETIEQREAGQLEDVLSRQLQKGLAGVTAATPENLTVAYEPVWAIGTGKTAQEKDIIEAHGVVRRLLGGILPSGGDSVRILYGGSVKPDNANSIISLDNVDGVLVGGASLQAESFSRIVLA